MPSISSRTVPLPAQYEPAVSTNHPPDFGSMVGLQPSNVNPMLRCTLPQITAAPDNLRQFQNGGIIPQTRVFPLIPIFSR